MNGIIKQVIYWFFAIIPIPLTILSPAVWPPHIIDTLMNYGFVAFGIVSSIKLIIIYKRFIAKIIPFLLSGLYGFSLIFIVYTKVH
ncbi:MAG: hypothetical protein QNK32_00350 [Porticoccus sp.]|nr:hypothetical protein [Porticoccus sp.]